MSTVLENIESLSASEKILMVEEIWDNVAKTSGDVPIPEWQKKELDRLFDSALDRKLWSGKYNDLFSL